MVQTCARCGRTHDSFSPCTTTLTQTPGRTTLVGVDEALVGNVVAERYQVGEVIGKGANGTVFAIEHLSFARSAAMKVLRPHYASDELLSRVFHGEARAAWTVLHPNLCEVFDIGSLPDGAPFFVMERLEGETLATRIARERLSVAAAVDVLMQMLSAIAAIHARDLLLRDLRPQNVYLAARRGCRPLLKILDFGLARLTPLDRVHAEWDALRATVGTSDGVGSTAIPYYLSPERTRGENGIEPASDLFIAAVIFYEALTGVRPFAASSFAELLDEICEGLPVPLHERRPDLSPDLSQFVSRALSPSPRHRPASAKDMQDELRSIFEGGGRRGSVSMQAATSSGSVDAFASRAGGPPPTSRHVSGAFEMPRTPTPAELDDTKTDRGAPIRIVAPPGYAHVPRVNPEAPLSPEDVSTASRQLDPAVLDEASAESSDRTVPPPRPPEGIHVEVDAAFGALLSPANAGDPNAANALRRDLPRDIDRGSSDVVPEDEDTETMRLGPELRARVDELIASKPVQPPIKVLPRPLPPPQRGAKPRG